MSSIPTPAMTISVATAKRFLLGRQGLWPGKRWKGRSGVLEAVQTLGSVQMDPLTIVARSHDLVLWNRVSGYRPAHLEHWSVTDRQVFDYGGVLCIQPIEELPFWRLHMERRREDPKYYLPLLKEHPDLFDAVRSLIKQEGPLPAKAIAKHLDDAPGKRTTSAGTVGSYRSGSVVGRVAYQLWMTGELMTHHREGFERHYDLAERVAPAKLLNAVGEPDVIDHFATRILGSSGLLTESRWRTSLAYLLHRKIEARESNAWLHALLTAGSVMQVKVEGQRSTYLADAAAGEELEVLASDGVPKNWGRAPESFVRLLSPLESIVRNHAKSLFGFEYIWEIYKPAEKRQYGPYTMPILYGDALVGRLDARVDRESGVLHVNGVWLERPDLEKDRQFTKLLTEEIRALAEFSGAETIEVHHTEPEALQKILA